MNTIRRRLRLETLEGRETPSSMVPVQIIDTLGHVAAPNVAAHVGTSAATGASFVTLPPPRPGLLLPD
jgi:hypothetical protein